LVAKEKKFLAGGFNSRRCSTGRGRSPARAFLTGQVGLDPALSEPSEHRRFAVGFVYAAKNGATNES
jgi:hypothetical protein